MSETGEERGFESDEMIAKKGNTTNLFNHQKVSHPSDYAESLGLRTQESPSQVAAGLCRNNHRFVVICCHFLHKYCINNAVLYLIAKDVPFWQKTYNGVK